MAASLHDAGLDPEDVDWICAHGTGTKRNDPAEATAIRTVFGDHADRLAVSSLKGSLGHLLSGAGGVAFVVAALATQQNRIPPTVNLRDPDPAGDLDHVLDRGREQPVRVSLNNAFGFGGQNSCIALKEYEEGAR